MFLRRTKLGGASAWAGEMAGKAAVDEAEPDEDAMRRRWTDSDINITDMAILGALPLVALWLARIVSGRYPLIPEVLWLTTIALIVAQLPWVRKLRGAEMLSYFALHIFFIVLGAASQLGMVFEAGLPIFGFMIAIIAVHVVVAYGGRMAGADRPAHGLDREPGSDRRAGFRARHRHGHEVAPAGRAGGDRGHFRVRAGQLPRVCLRVDCKCISWMRKDPVRHANRRSEDPPSDTLTLREGLSPVAGIEGVDVLVTGAGRGLGRGIAMALAGGGRARLAGFGDDRGA